MLSEKVVSELMGHTEAVNAGHYNYSTAEYAEKKQAYKNMYSKVFNIFDFYPETKKAGSA